MIPPPDHGKTHSDPGGGTNSPGHDDAKATADAAEQLLGWWQQRINQWLTDPQTLAQASQQWLRWQEWLASQGMTAPTGAASPFAGAPPSPAPSPASSPTNPADQSDDHDALQRLANRLDQLEQRLARLEQQQRAGGFTPA
ncbi:MAG: hypothetical protein FGM23_00110 [Alphaproteobacteria bacterium]|nr:hypothetical protein [Alphaproteobacteria bacterium]